MDPQFWRDRWREGKTAFHEGRANTFLEAHVDRLRGSRVLVPLCGKTEDLAFLAGRGHTVIGIELVEDAVRAFFAEHELTPKIDGRAFSAGPITILAGDLFSVTDVGPIDAIYDRAALVALPPELRPQYIAHLRTLVPAGKPGLVITLEYPQHLMAGPPFSVPQAEVREHYAHVELLDAHPAVGGRAGELGSAIERCYAVAL